MTKYIAYYRVSTREQGLSGLGLEAQKNEVENYVGANNIMEAFTEVESGKKKNRPLLDKAIELCKQYGHTLVVSKLDRLGRVASQLHTIKDHVNLLVVEKPNMEPLEFAIHAGLAEQERVKISARTKAALAAKKAQGFKLGSPKNMNDDARKKSAESRRRTAQQKNLNAYKMAKRERDKGESLRNIAAVLNDIGFTTSRGGKFYASSVKNLLELFEEKKKTSKKKTGKKKTRKASKSKTNTRKAVASK